LLAAGAAGGALAVWTNSDYGDLIPPDAGGPATLTATFDDESAWTSPVTVPGLEDGDNLLALDEGSYLAVKFLAKRTQQPVPSYTSLLVQRFEPTSGLTAETTLEFSDDSYYAFMTNRRGGAAFLTTSHIWQLAPGSDWVDTGPPPVHLTTANDY